MRGLGFFQRQGSDSGSSGSFNIRLSSSKDPSNKMIQVLLEENKDLKSENKKLMDTNERLHEDLQLLRKKSDGRKRHLENILKQQKVSFDSMFHDFETAKKEIEQLKKILAEAQQEQQPKQQQQEEQQLMPSSSKAKTTDSNNKGVLNNTKSQSEILKDVMIELAKSRKTEVDCHKPAAARSLSPKSPRRLRSSSPRRPQRKLSPTSVLQVDFSCSLEETKSSNNEQKEEESCVVFVPSLRTPSPTTTMTPNNTTSSCDITRRNIEDRKIKIAQMRQRLEENKQRLRSHVEYHDGNNTDVNLRNLGGSSNSLKELIA